jgi:hypothetical protein
MIVEDNSLLICDNKNDDFEILGLSNRMNCSLKSAKIVKFEVFSRQKNDVFHEKSYLDYQICSLYNL